jgi:ubiquinol-cytochrome c reductase iron-sulfur subunit
MRAGRRNFLYATTTAVSAVGLAALAWPLIDQMNPDAAVRAAGDVLDIDLASLAPGERRVVRWHNLPIFLVKRTNAMLSAMQEPKFVDRLHDAGSAKRQQPTYAANWHRSIDPALSVLVGVCTYCSCVPQYVTDPFPPDLQGGYECPCCASHFDPAGRAHAGPAQYNLPVPPYELRAPSRVLIGRNRSDELFTFGSIERI